MDICNWVPHNLNNSFQKLLVQILSMSDIIVIGKLCNFTILLKNTSAMVAAVYGCFSAIKWLYLVYPSTTTKMVEYPCDLGSPYTKSMDTSSQGPSSIGRGHSRPGYLQCSCLAC